MRSALTFATVFFAALAVFLFLEVRNTWNAYISFVVSETGSSLKISRELEAAIAGGDIEFAISRLRKQREAREFLLSETLSSLQSPSWRWGNQDYNIRNAEKHLDADDSPLNQQ